MRTLRADTRKFARERTAYLSEEKFYRFESALRCVENPTILQSLDVAIKEQAHAMMLQDT